MMECVRYETKEPRLPVGGMAALTDDELNEVVNFRMNVRNEANDSLERACAEARKRGLR